MVKIDGDVMDIHPIDRMEELEGIKQEKRTTISKKKKELEELEKDKLKEIEELDSKKKKDLEEIDRRKKELQELEKKKLKEIDETEEMIEKSFQDLMRHKRKIIQEEEDAQKTKTLEALTENAPKNVAAQPNYGKFFENLETPTKVYQVANPGFYANLIDLRNRTARGEITERDEMFINQLQDRMRNFENNPEYVRNDDNNYIRRSMNVLREIAKYNSRVD